MDSYRSLDIHLWSPENRSLGATMQNTFRFDTIIHNFMIISSIFGKLGSRVTYLSLISLPIKTSLNNRIIVNLIFLWNDVIFLSPSQSKFTFKPFHIIKGTSTQFLQHIFCFTSGIGVNVRIKSKECYFVLFAIWI